MLFIGMTVVVHPLAAQRTAGWVDAGGSSVQQPRSIDRSAWTFGLGMLHAQGPWSLLAQGAVTVANDSAAATQAALRLSFAPARLRWSLTDVDVSTTTVGIVLPGNDGNNSVSLRQHVRVKGLQLFAGGGVGNTSRYALNSNSAAINAGVTGARGPFVGTASVQRATTDDWQLMEASGIFLRAAAPAYQLHDATLELLWRGPRAITVTASQSWRAGFGNTTGTSSGGALLVTWAPAASIQLIAHGGRQLADVLRGVPQVNYVGMTARWHISRGRASPRAIDDSPVAHNAEARLEHLDGHTDVVLRVDASESATVDVATSATEWKPQRLVRDGGAFSARLTLPSGTHRVAIRVNGGEWRAPRGLVRVDDDFGGAAGLVVVP